MEPIVLRDVSIGYSSFVLLDLLVRLRGRASCAGLHRPPNQRGHRELGYPNTIFREPTQYHDGLARYEEKSPYDDPNLKISCERDSYGNVDDDDCEIQDRNQYRRNQWELGAHARGGRCKVDVSFDKAGTVTKIAANNAYCLRNAQARRYSR